MKTIRLIRESLLFVAALTLVACASEDTQQKDETKQPETKYVATFTGNQPKADSQAKSRTTATHTIGNPAQVLWEATDKIWVKADDGNFYQSEVANFAASATPADHSRANFHLATGSYLKFNPEVRYTNTNSENTVVIASNQIQNSPNNFSHLGTAGDCGTAIARGGGNDHEFTLQHKAAYLCFVPRCMNTALGPNIQLMKIVVKADKDIAGTYDFSDGSLKDKTPTTGASKEITLRTGYWGHWFTLDTTVPDVNKNGAYMVIAPGTYNFTIEYYIRDVYNLQVTVTKTLNGFDCPEGQIKDIKAWIDKDFRTITNYNTKFYMWDAKQHYWYGHLRSDGRPDNEDNYARNSTDPRWYNTYNRFWGGADAETERFKALPNANEMMWYAYKGDPHWVTDGYIYAVEGHLRKVYGIWLKKKAKILADEHITEAYMRGGYPDGTPSHTYRDWIYNYNGVQIPKAITPSTSPVPNKTDYFFLPAMGYWYYDHNYDFGFGGEYAGHYWSSTATPTFSGSAYCLEFWATEVKVDGTAHREFGCLPQPFE